MLNQLSSFILVVLIIVSSSCCSDKTEDKDVNYNVHTFYYGWYGSPEHDGQYRAWNHHVVPHWIDTTWNNLPAYKGGDDIGANFYPALGNYSSNDTTIIKTHMKQIKEAGIGVMVLSWWGIDSYPDKSITKYLDLADRYKLKIAFHIEPFYRDVETFIKSLAYINSEYSIHPAFYRYHDKPIYYIYDPHKIKLKEWQRVFSDSGELSIRDSELDAIYAGVWTREIDGEFLYKSGFDAIYTYHVSDGWVYGSTSANWQKMASYAKENNMLFIPCPGPGYIDTRIRPWNSKSTRAREMGTYYENMFNNALLTSPKIIGITSFNEWFEGTQIEPAIPKEIEGYTYEDYGKDVDPMFYIYKTRELTGRFNR